MTEQSRLYRVKGWEQYFESAKSKTYGIKQQTYMPNKHGLGYRRLLSHPAGEALFGAWCALCQVLSRQLKPRQGYLTDTGKASGTPWNASDISLLIGYKKSTIEKMIDQCALPEIGWLEVVKEPTLATPKDTARIPQGYCGPLSSDSPSPLPLPLPSPLHIETALAPTRNTGTKPKPFWSPESNWENISEADKKTWCQAYPACDVDRQLAAMTAWLKANPAKARKSNWRRFIVNWLAKSQDRGGDTPTNVPTTTAPTRRLSERMAELQEKARLDKP